MLWIVALVLSTGVRWFRGFEPAPLEGQDVYIAQVDSTVAIDARVALAYRDFMSNQGDAPLLLLHGNPMAGGAMVPLAEAMGADRRILIPDLPGLGYSGRNLSAYSAEHQVTVLLDWLDALGVKTVHLAGYSQGSAVALEFADRVPERTESVSLIAGVGLQEHELLGNYNWNQPIYTAYYSILWTARWLTPHFGYIDKPVFASTAAQNFADTDLRRNAGIIDRLQKPTLILHAVDDSLVPFAAAQAHAEILTQAYFYNMPGGHLGLFSHTSEYAARLQDFIENVESGQARGRVIAEVEGNTERPGLDIVLPDEPSLSQSGLIAVLLFAFVFFSEDLACIIGGILAAGGAVSLPAAIVGCFAGIFVSDIGLYVIGRVLGDRAFRIKFIAKAREGGSYSRLKETYTRKGLQLVFMTRFIPGSRVIAYVTAGVMKLPLPRFSLWLGLAAAIWTPILVSIAFYVGKPLIHWWEQSGLIVLPLVALGIAVIYFGVHLLVQSFTYRGRRTIRGRWIRLTQWEFWPALPVYTPVVFYCLWQAMKYRSLTVWAACNPGMYPASGLALESKSEILNALNSDSGCVADWARIDPSDTLENRLSKLSKFMQAYNLAWPIVLKPDIGQRGEGVAVIHSYESAVAYLTDNVECVIAQRFISGAEFGVFYMRLPEQESRLFSITEKVLPELIGDGERTLERLILDDPRAVALAKHYLKVNRGRLYEVPATGDRIQLVELGTHCRGAIFLDGNRYQTEDLREKLDEVLSTYEGFGFGRFDLRIPSGEDLAAGKHIQILELNGVSSESTDIYDPKNSIFHAWCVLCRQWKHAFEIGDANRSRGAKVPTFGEVLAVLRGHRARSPYEVE